MEVLVYRMNEFYARRMQTSTISVRWAFWLCMEQHCGRKIELRLTKKQERLCRQSCAVARRAYNWQLAIQNANYDSAKQATPEVE